MSQSITVQCTIPISKHIVFGRSLMFHQWIPEDDNEILTRKNGNFTSRLCINRSCLDSIPDVDDKELFKFSNIMVKRVLVDVQISEVSNELVKFIYDERQNPEGIHHGIQLSDKNYEKLKTEYCKLGETVLEEAFTLFNRLIIFARNYKDQFWLQERIFDVDLLSNLNNEFNARAKLQDYDWIRWCPPAVNMMKVTLPDKNASIRREDWAKFQAFASENSRIDFVLVLLANADLFVAEGRRRNAIVEATTALELALSRFIEAPNFQSLRTGDDTNRINYAHLKAQVEHLGFSGTINYLLPLLFPATVLPTDIIKSCQDAITQRNLVIHNGQHDVNRKIIRSLVLGIRKACEILDNSTVKS